MKKTVLSLALALIATATFAQDAPLEISGSGGPLLQI
jgi:hypothetical protein